MGNLQKLVDRAKEVLENDDLVAQWLEIPIPVLNDKKPIELVKNGSWFIRSAATVG